MQNKNTKYLVLALFSCLIWAGSFVIARGVHNFIPPITLAFWRWIVAFVVMLAISYKKISSQIQIIKKNWKYIFLMGFFAVGVFNTIVYISAHYTTAHHISLISSISPIGTLVIAGILGFEALTKNKIIGAIIAFTGAIIVISHGSFEFLMKLKWNLGDLMLISSALIWASWSAMLHYKPKDLDAKVFLTLQIFVGLIFLFPLYIWEYLSVAETPFTFDAWSVYIYLGVGSSCLAWLAWQESTKRVGAVQTSLIYYTMPVFTSILAVITLSEPLKLYHFLGFTFILVGILVSIRKSKS
ncbi:MAG: DMT family transporter [Rickettsiales bacterium]|nr:DMT family transporter [Rickettsiales bacterium]